MRPTKILLLLDNVHMGLGHDGLALLARKFGRNPERLADGELLMFLNKQKDKLKIMGAKGVVLGYLKMPKGRRIMLDAIQFIPNTFGGSGFNYDDALKTALERKLARVSTTNVGPLAAYRAMERSGLTARTTN